MLLPWPLIHPGNMVLDVDVRYPDVVALVMLELEDRRLQEELEDKLEEEYVKETSLMLLL